MPSMPKEQTPGRSTVQWRRLAGAALSLDPQQAGEIGPELVASAINNHPQASDYDGPVADELLKLLEVMQQEADPRALQDVVQRMLGALSADARRRLMLFSGDENRRREFLLDAAEALPAPTIIPFVVAAGELSRRRLTPTLTRLVAKLARQAEEAAEPLRGHSDAALRDLMEELVQTWWPIDTSAAAYGLDDRFRGEAARPGVEQPHTPGADRVLQLSLEIGQAGTPLLTAMQQMLKQGKLRLLLAMVQQLPNTPAAEEILDQLSVPVRFRQVLRDEPVDFGAVDMILGRAGLNVARTLLDELAESESRATRRGIFDRLVRLGTEVAPLAAERLGDNRWFVQRNLLALLAELGAWPEGIRIEPLLQHPDARVRKEAVKLIVSQPTPPGEALVAALKDDDPQVLRLGIHGARRGWNEGLATVLAKRMGSDDFPGDLRLTGLRLLRDSRSPLALDLLLRHVWGGKTLFGKPKLADKSPEMMAALEALAATWSAEPRAAQMLELARASRDPQIQAAAGAAPAEEAE